MLAGEQGRWTDDGDLLAAHGHDEGGAERDFGLAEAHIAADEPVHRLAAGQIPQHIGDRVELIFRLFVREARAEFIEQP